MSFNVVMCRKNAQNNAVVIALFEFQLNAVGDLCGEISFI